MINCKSPEAKLWQFIAVQSKICLHKGSFMFETEDLTGQYVNIYIRVSTDEQAKKGYRKTNAGNILNVLMAQ